MRIALVASDDEKLWEAWKKRLAHEIAELAEERFGRMSRKQFGEFRKDVWHGLDCFEMGPFIPTGGEEAA